MLPHQDRLLLPAHELKQLGQLAGAKLDGVLIRLGWLMMILSASRSDFSALAKSPSAGTLWRRSASGVMRRRRLRRPGTLTRSYAAPRAPRRTCLGPAVSVRTSRRIAVRSGSPTGRAGRRRDLAELPLQARAWPCESSAQDVRGEADEVHVQLRQLPGPYISSDSVIMRSKKTGEDVVIAVHVEGTYVFGVRNGTAGWRARGR